MSTLGRKNVALNVSGCSSERCSNTRGHSVHKGPLPARPKLAKGHTSVSWGFQCPQSQCVFKFDTLARKSTHLSTHSRQHIHDPASARQKEYVCLRVSACVCVDAKACMYVGVCAWVRVCACMRACVCMCVVFEVGRSGGGGRRWGASKALVCAP